MRYILVSCLALTAWQQTAIAQPPAPKKAVQDLITAFYATVSDAIDSIGAAKRGSR
jgi:hypothetical protein